MNTGLGKRNESKRTLTLKVDSRDTKFVQNFAAETSRRRSFPRQIWMGKEN